MPVLKLSINGQTREVDVDPDTPLLWVLREWVGLTGTKYGCGIAQCGACTVHVDGVATRSCSLPAGSVGASKITTIEGLSPDGMSHPVQVAWLQHEVPQCGYCQSGQIMASAALLAAKPNPTDADIEGKFRLIATDILGQKKTDRVIAIVRNFETVDTVSELIECLTP